MVKNTPGILFCLLYFCLATTAVADQRTYIKLQLDSDEVYSGDTVVLEVESTGLLDPIDYTIIDDQADLIRETRGSHIAVIGGKVAEIAINRMVLVPKKTGVMVIGPLTAGDVSSNSVYLKVLDADRPDWQPQADDLQINTTLSPISLMVNQKGLLTIELLHRYPISNESVSLPALDGFSKRTLVKDRRTLTGDNDLLHSTMWQYLVFARQSGSIQIDGINWSGTIAKSRIEKSEFTRQSPPLMLTIESPSNSSSNDTAAAAMDWWLPATTLQLTEEWSAPPTQLRAGDELNRIIRIEAASVLSGQIPTPVVPESRAIQQTLINTQRYETLTNDNVVSSAEFTYRVKAQSPIPVFLDTVRLPWWNTVDNTIQEAIIPARRINVGLPDRTDVLRKLAIQETGVNRFKYWLQSTGWFRLLLGFIGVVSGIYLLWMLLPAVTFSPRLLKLKKKQQSKLRMLADKGDYETLYSELYSSQSELPMNLSHKKLLLALETRLFSGSAVSVATQVSDRQISILLKDALRQITTPAGAGGKLRHGMSANYKQIPEQTLVKL